MCQPDRNATAFSLLRLPLGLLMNWSEPSLAALPGWFAHYNEVHPHRALGYRLPRAFIAAQKPR